MARATHANQVRDLVRFLVFHAEHEDDVLDGPIRQVLPEQADAIAREHVALEERMADLVTLADLVFDCERTDARAAVHALYLELAAFVSAYLAHQDVEERVVMPALDAAFGVPGLLELHARILADISPEDMGWSLSLMIPAMNVDDRTELLGGMRAEAPVEVFDGVWGLVTTVLPAADIAAVAARLGIAGTAAGLTDAPTRRTRHGRGHGRPHAHRPGRAADGPPRREVLEASPRCGATTSST